MTRAAVVVLVALGTLCIAVVVARLATWGYPSLMDVNIGLAFVHMMTCAMITLAAIYTLVFLWAVNPSFTIGRKTKLPKATVVK
jgi:hypothetical protein